MPLPSIHNLHGERLAFTHVEGEVGRRDLVVIGHGVTSDRERPWSRALSDALAARGIASMRLAFSGNGDSEGVFGEATISKEVGDLGAVLDALEDRRVSYIGHSMGGAVGLLRAAVDDRVHALVSLAAIGHPREFVERMFGHLNVGEPMLDKPHCPFSVALWDDLVGLDTLVPDAARVRAPWLLVHGTADDVVPVGHSRDVRAGAGASATLVELEGVDHAFTGAGLAPMVEAVVPWLAARLG